MSHCDTREPVEVENFLSQNNFQLFFKTCFSMFQDSGIILSEKNFSDFQTNLSPGIAMRSQRQKLPLTCNQRRRTLPVRITLKGDWTSGVSLRYESTSRGQKFSKSKKFSILFQNVFFHVSGLWHNFKRKIFFFDFQINLSPGIARRSRYRYKIPKAKTPPYL